VPDKVLINKPNVLLIAEAANPEWVSVPLVGWSLAVALGKVANVHIVTQIRNKDAFLRAGMVEGRDFTAIDSEAFARPLWKLGSVLRMGEGKGWTALQAVSALSYPYFERLIWKQFGADIKAGKYDIVHRVTPLSPTISSPIAAKCARAGVPFIMGPLNGGVPWPKSFDAERRQEREWLSYVRGVYKALPGRKKTLKHASAVLVGSRHTQSEIPDNLQDKCIYMPENAIDPARFSNNAKPVNGVLRACFIGRMVPYKGPDMLLQAALPLLNSGELKIDMIGDGPMLEQLKSIVTDCADAVTFHGWCAHEQVQDIAANCQLFAFPSIREFGGGVVLEAMALGLTPLIVDYAGPGELVTKTTGFKVPIGTRYQIISEFREKLKTIVQAPDILSATGAASRKRVQDYFTWDKKAQQVSQVYDWVLKQGEKPEFFEGLR
jgi:glycosyltransferase involved in cell wall biosynthesis